MIRPKLDGAPFGVIIVALVLIGLINLVALTFLGWFAIEPIAGIDLSFDEALGVGLLLTLAQGSS